MTPPIICDPRPAASHTSAASAAAREEVTMSSAREQAEARNRINPVLAGVMNRDPDAFGQAAAERQAEDDARYAPLREYDAQQKAIRDAAKAQADAEAAAAAVPPTMAEQVEQGVRNALGIGPKVPTPAEARASIAAKSRSILASDSLDPAVRPQIAGA